MRRYWRIYYLFGSTLRWFCRLLQLSFRTLLKIYYVSIKRVFHMGIFILEKIIIKQSVFFPLCVHTYTFFILCFVQFIKLLLFIRFPSSTQRHH